MDKVLERAEMLLTQIAAAEDQIAWQERRIEEEMQAVRARNEGPLAKFKQVRDAYEKELIKLMKKHKTKLFDETDQVDLKMGILLHGEEDKVKIPRNALEKIKAQGWKEAVKTVESVDREVVQKWPDERLVVIGAERKPVETFSYEIKEYGAGKQGG
jgi:hypothetical protein